VVVHAWSNDSASDGGVSSSSVARRGTYVFGSFEGRHYSFVCFNVGGHFRAGSAPGGIGANDSCLVLAYVGFGSDEKARSAVDQYGLL
jgi:hypothetical protein